MTKKEFNHMKTIDKSVLKEGYYWESNSWYDSCPENLLVKAFKIEIFSRNMSHEEILKNYKITPYSSYAQAASVLASILPDLKNDYKSRIVYFKENEVLFRFSAWRHDDGQLDVDVLEVDLSSRCGAGSGVCFRTEFLNLEYENQYVGDFESLAARIEKLEKWHDAMKEAFYKKEL